jgi:hypothetical protein
MTQIPDVAVGWRVWRMRDSELRSWSADESWKVGENVARCLHGREHAEGVPGAGCRCGLWALDSPRRCLQMVARDGEPDQPLSGDIAIGLVAGWGGIARHRGGFRAERGRVLMLFSNLVGITRLAPARPWHVLRNRSLSAVGERYGVAVVDLRSAMELGLLEEMGLDARRIEEVRTLLRPAGWSHVDELVPAK